MIFILFTELSQRTIPAGFCFQPTKSDRSRLLWPAVCGPTKAKGEKRCSLL